MQMLLMDKSMTNLISLTLHSSMFSSSEGKTPKLNLRMGLVMNNKKFSVVQGAIVLSIYI